MKRISIIFLQVVVALIGIGAFALLLWEPWVEGVNAHATTLREIYFDDPFLALVYIGSIPFFIAVRKAIKVLGYVRLNKIFSQDALKSLKTIKYCALTIIGFVVVEEIYIMLNHGKDDPAGGIFMGILIIFFSLIVATVAAMFEKILQNAVDIKTENDLTV